MFDDYTPQERFNKISEILAQGTLNYIKSLNQPFIDFKSTFHSWISDAYDSVRHDKSIKMVAMTATVIEVNNTRMLDNPYPLTEPKIQSISVRISRD